MSHLTNIKQRSLFQTDVAPRSDAPASEQRDTNLTVTVDMVPGEYRDTRAANYPKYDWPSVDNLPCRKKGHHY